MIRLIKEALFQELGYEPHEGQLLVHRSRKRRRVLACGVRWGKSLAAAMEALAAALEPRKRSIGWVVAPTLDLAEKVFREVVILASERMRHRIVELKLHEKKLVLRNLGGGLSEVKAKTADNPVSLLGEGLDWLIADEAARLRPSIWESYLSQRLIDKKGWALLISTPKGKGWFYDAWKAGQAGRDPDTESWNAPSLQNPHLDRALIEAEKARLPDRVFRQEYGAEFLEGEGSVFRNVRECATGVLRGPVHGGRYFAGLDLAKVRDFTVLVILDEARAVVHIDRFNKLDWNLQVGRIKAALDRFNHATLFVDSTGAGEPVFEDLLRAGCRAEPYHLSAASKSALIDGLALLFERKELELPKVELCPEMVEELEGFEYSITEAGNVKTGSAPGMHDDMVIALALAAWCRAEDAGEIKVQWIGGRGY